MNKLNNNDYKIMGYLKQWQNDYGRTLESSNVYKEYIKCRKNVITLNNLKILIKYNSYTVEDVQNIAVALMEIKKQYSRLQP